MTQVPEDPKVYTLKEMQRLAHDLRNSLSSMYTYAQLLELSLSEQDRQREKQFATSICESIEKMKDLIDQRVDISPL